MKKLIVLGLASVLLTACSTRVSPGYVGIQVNYSGTDRGVSSYPIVTGRVWYNPYSESILEYPTFVQNVTLTHSLNEGKPVNEEITFTNKDQMQIAADISYAYRLEPSKVPEFYVKFRSDDLEKFTHGYMRNLIRDKFNDIAGKYAIEQIMGDNGPFLQEVKAAVARDVAPFGVILESQFGFVGAPRPPQAVIDNINGKVAAVQLAQRTENELRTAEAEAKKKVATAEGEGRAILAVAEAQAQANRKLAESITPNLLELKRLEKWNGALPHVNGGSVNPFISLEGKK